MAKQQQDFSVVYFAYVDKKGFWDLGLGEIFTGLALSRQQIKDGGGFVNASVRAFAAKSNSDRVEERIDEKTGKPYLRVNFAIAMKKKSACDLSAQELATGLSLALSGKTEGNFVKAAVKETHKNSRSTLVVGG